MSTSKKPTRYVTVKLTPNQVRLLYTEMANNAACTSGQINREYNLLADKLNKVRQAR